MDKKENEEVVSCWGFVVHLFSRKNSKPKLSHSKPRKGVAHKSKVFRYSPLSYSRNFEDYWREDDDFDDSSLRSFSSSFQDYSNFPIDIQTTFNFPISYEQLGEFTHSEDHYSCYYADSTKDINNVDPNLGCIGAPCKEEASIFNVGLCPENESKNKMKKVNNGQPSKNLMAERRRRKRLNDRLSMLRSVVPKISKMDRTSILGDTIDYMKELLERINNLQEEILMEDSKQQLGVEMTIFKGDGKANEILVRNAPKMDVEKMNGETRIKMSCGMKPGLLLSTMNTVEELGLEIQQCVISCFSEFTMQASCSQELKERDAEDIKQALFRNIAAGISLTASTFV